MALKNYLIEGVSASGKSSVCKELKNRGYNAVDGDTLAEFRDPESGNPTREPKHENWVWVPEKIKALLDDNEELLFVCGGARNRKDFLAQFDKIFYLDIDEATLRHRLKHRPGDTFGKKEGELRTVLQLNATGREKPENATTIDAGQPLILVVDAILSRL